MKNAGQASSSPFFKQEGGSYFDLAKAAGDGGEEAPFERTTTSPGERSANSTWLQVKAQQMVLSPSRIYRPSPSAHADSGPGGTLRAVHSKGQPRTWAPPGETRAPAPPRPPRGNGAQPRANESSGISFIQCGAGLLPGKGRGVVSGAGPPRAGERAVPAPRPDQSAPRPGGEGGTRSFFPPRGTNPDFTSLNFCHPRTSERARGGTPPRRLQGQERP